MKPHVKGVLICLSILVVPIAISMGMACVISLYVDTKYETGVTITPNPEYQIELFYSDECTPKGILTLQFKPRVVGKARSVIVGNYKTARPMHIWYWVLTFGDDEVYRETINRDVNKDDFLKFIYVVN